MYVMRVVLCCVRLCGVQFQPSISMFLFADLFLQCLSLSDELGVNMDGVCVMCVCVLWCVCDVMRCWLFCWVVLLGGVVGWFCLVFILCWFGMELFVFPCVVANFVVCAVELVCIL